MFVCLGALGPNGADRATAQSRAPSDIEATRPTVAATAITIAEAPIIDGDLSDAAWSKASVIDQFTQLDPDNGEPGTQRTVARIMYDENNLYVGIHIYDNEPNKIIANAKSRDGLTNRDDAVRLMLDPLMTRRDGYFFETNALGARVDSLLQNNTNTLINWNTIWAERSQRVVDGWVAEFAIPFRNISYDPKRTEWGFDITRKVRRRAENTYWGHLPASTGPNDITYAGTMTGLSGMSQGAGLDVQLYAAEQYKHHWAGTEDNDTVFRPSGNAFYRITPSLTGTMTFNTDFSDAPLDKRQVNTSRFSLFTEETRQFFLQDVASFEFGGHAFTTGLDNGRPFFSRNIGLVNGRPVPIIAGVKLSGEYQGIGIGAVSVLSDGTDTTDGQILSVARITAPVFGESKVGAIVSHGDPTGLTQNSVAGADFQFMNSSFFGPRQRLQVDTSYLQSFSDTQGSDKEIAASVVLPNEPWGGEFNFKQIGENFFPAIGFANRRGIMFYDGQAKNRMRFRNSELHWADLGTEWTFVTGLNGVLESRDNGAFVAVQTANNDQLQIHLKNSYENVSSFLLPGKVVVPTGEYTWNHVDVTMRTTQSRLYFINWEVDCCRYYNGNYLKSALSFDYIINETWAFVLTHTMSLIDLPTGQVNIHIAELSVTTNFTPDMHIDSQFQYDNITKRFTALARYRWEYEPGSELFVSLGEQSAITDPFFHPHYASDNTRAQIRIGHTLQF